MNNKRINLAGPFAFVLALLVLAVFVPINLIANGHDKFYDMTPNSKYTLDEKTVQLLDETKDKDIDIYFLSELRFLEEDPTFLPLYHTLTELDERDNITLHCFDPNEDVETAKMLDPTGIIKTTDGDVFVKCGNVIKKVEAARIFQKINNFQNYFGEELISGAIKTVTNGSLPTIYFLTGHGEASIYETPYDETSGYSQAEGFGIFATQLFAKNYDVKELDLSKTKGIPGNASILYLAGPQKDLSDEETKLIEGYLAQGGAMSFLLDPCDTEGRFYNIEKLLDEFGIIMDYNCVSETLAANELENRDSQKDPNFIRVEFVDNSELTEDYTEDLTSDLILLIDNGAYTAGVSNTRSFALVNDDAFAADGYIERSALYTNAPDPTNPLEPIYSTDSHACGGDDTTADEAESLDETELYLGCYAYNKSTGAKIIVLGSSEMVNSEKMWPTTSGTQQLTVFSNTWLYDTDESLGVGSKIDSYDNMKFSSEKEANSTIAVIVIFPIAVAVLGVAVWLKRRHA